MPPGETRRLCSATATVGSWRIRHSGIATRLILADCGAAFSEPGREAFRNMAAASKAKGMAAITDVAMRRLFAPEFQEKHPDLMHDRREAFLRTDPEVFRAACVVLAGLDLRPELGKVTAPVLVLVGEHDEATPPPMSRELAAGLPNARLKVIPGCAHVPQLQSPESFVYAITDFLADPTAHITGDRSAWPSLCGRFGQVARIFHSTLPIPM